MTENNLPMVANAEVDTDRPVEEKKTPEYYNVLVTVNLADEVYGIDQKYEDATYFDVRTALSKVLGCRPDQIILSDVMEKFDENSYSSDRDTEVVYRMFGSKVLLTATMRSRRIRDYYRSENV